jgi:hypothetical protein
VYSAQRGHRKISLHLICRFDLKKLSVHRENL